MARRGPEYIGFTVKGVDHGPKPEPVTGGALLALGMRFGLSCLKYLAKRSEYSRFRPASFHLFKYRKLTRLRKVMKFNGSYYSGILRVPHWPSNAFDVMVAHGGLDLAIAATSLRTEVDTVILSITGRCELDCRHCYESESGNSEIPLERLKEVIQELQEIGVSILVLSGGEPLLRYDELLELIETANKDRSDVHVHTSGAGVTKERAISLKTAGLKAAGVGLDDFRPAAHDRFRGEVGAFEQALRAIEHLRRAGVFPYTNVCLRTELIESGGLWRYLRMAKDAGVGVVFLLEPKPCGRLSLEDVQELITEEDRIEVEKFGRAANETRRYRDYPQVSSAMFLERPEQLGCLMGGVSHFAITSRGDVQPCAFLPVSFGNIMKERLTDIYKRMRSAIPAQLRIECPSVLLSETITAKTAGGTHRPIPFEMIEKEWSTILTLDSDPA